MITQDELDVLVNEMLDSTPDTPCACACLEDACPINFGGNDDTK